MMLSIFKIISSTIFALVKKYFPTFAIEVRKFQSSNGRTTNLVHRLFCLLDAMRTSGLRVHMKLGIAATSQDDFRRRLPFRYKFATLKTTSNIVRAAKAKRFIESVSGFDLSGWRMLHSVISATVTLNTISTYKYRIRSLQTTYNVCWHQEFCQEKVLATVHLELFAMKYLGEQLYRSRNEWDEFSALPIGCGRWSALNLVSNKY